MTWRARLSAAHRSLSGRVVLTTFTNVLMSLVGLATGALSARILGPAGRGELAAIQTWPLILATLAMLGMPEAVIYFSAREPRSAGRTTASAMTLALVGSCAFAAFGWVLLPTLLAAQSPLVVNTARIYLLIIPLYALVPMLYHPLQGRKDIVMWNALRIVPGVSWLVVLLLAWATPSADARWIALAHLLMLAALFLPLAYLVRRRLDDALRPEPGRWRGLLSYGIPGMLGSIPSMLNVRVDQILLIAVLDPHLVGLYVVAVAWGGIAMALPNAVGAIIFPHVASQASTEGRGAGLAQALRYAVIVLLPLTIVIVLAAPLAIPLLFGAPFADAFGPAMVLAAAGSLAGMNLILTQGLRGLGRPSAAIWTEVGSLGATASLLFLLLPRLGLLGAAIASLLGVLAGASILLLQLVRLTRLPVRSFILPTAADARALMLQFRRAAAPFKRAGRIGSHEEPWPPPHRD